MKHAERNAAIYAARQGGRSYASIAKEFGLTGQRCREICLRAANPRKTHCNIVDLPAADGLTIRTQRALAFYPWPSLPVTLKMISACSEAELLRLPNFGRKSLRELRSWLALNGLSLTGSGQPPPVDLLATYPRRGPISAPYQAATRD